MPQTDDWSAFPAVAAPTATPAAPSFPGVIPGRVDPLKQAAEGRAERDQSLQETTSALQNQLTELTIGEKQQKAAETAKEAAAATAADSNARDKLIRIVAKLTSVARDANDNGGWFETGTSGAFSRNHLPEGTAGYDLGRDINTLQANFAFDALQAMRDASKTGGALGSISERELELLQSAIGNIDPNQSHQSFLNNLEGVRQAYLSKLALVDPEIATHLGYDSKAAEKAVLALNDAYSKEFGTGAVTIDRTPNATTPQGHPEDIQAIMTKYGVK